MDPADTRTTGPQQYANRSARAQKAILNRVNEALPLLTQALGAGATSPRRAIGASLPIPTGLQLAAHLDDLSVGGADVDAPLKREPWTPGRCLTNFRRCSVVATRRCGWFPQRNAPPTRLNAKQVPKQRHWICASTPILQAISVELRLVLFSMALNSPTSVVAATPPAPPSRGSGRGDLHRGGGPAEQAATAELVSLHRRHIEQRPYQHRLAHARTDWMAAEHTHDQHHRMLDHLDKQTETAPPLGDEAPLASTADTGRNLAVTPHPSFGAAVSAGPNIRMRIGPFAMAGGPNGIVTDDDIEQRRRQAIDADLASFGRRVSTRASWTTSSTEPKPPPRVPSPRPPRRLTMWFRSSR